MKEGKTAVRHISPEHMAQLGEPVRAEIDAEISAAWRGGYEAGLAEHDALATALRELREAGDAWGADLATAIRRSVGGDIDWAAFQVKAKRMNAAEEAADALLAGREGGD